jgi:S-adenosylmethionine:tRNA ribosyltransferase-isomerase
MDVRDFNFDLPPELIAQEPSAERSDARLLLVRRDTGAIAHTNVAALPDLLQSGDLIVVNNTRVFPARLLGRRVPSGGAVECLLIRREEGSDTGRTRVGPGSDPVAVSAMDPRAVSARWEALMHPGQKLKPGTLVEFAGIHTIHGEVLERRFYGRRLIRLWTEDGVPVDAAVDAIGHMPLPPYIKRGDAPGDRDRYQTVFARERGSIAAPTAGLHFTAPLTAALADRGVALAEITLHVGYGTFQPVRVERVEDHRLEPEHYEVSESAATAIDAARAAGRRIISVGTTTTRTLEAVAQAHDGRVAPGRGSTDLFIYPGFAFRVAGGLLTNFHLPQSSLFMLVSAFAGHGLARSAYDAAIAERYRFYSYGDAMLIL